MHVWRVFPQQMSHKVYDTTQSAVDKCFHALLNGACTYVAGSYMKCYLDFWCHKLLSPTIDVSTAWWTPASPGISNEGLVG